MMMLLDHHEISARRERQGDRVVQPGSERVNPPVPAPLEDHSSTLVAPMLVVTMRICRDKDVPRDIDGHASEPIGWVA
jgi:hypothetical protein